MTYDYGPATRASACIFGHVVRRRSDALARDVDAGCRCRAARRPGACARSSRRMPACAIRDASPPGVMSRWRDSRSTPSCSSALRTTPPLRDARCCAAAASTRRGRPLPVHAELAEALANASPLLAAERRDVHAAEHSLELHLPLLARVQPGVAVVPILMGEHTRDGRRCARRCAGAGDGRPPGRLRRQQRSLALSPARHGAAPRRGGARLLRRVRRRGVDDALERDPGHACGGVPAAAVMRASRAVGATAGGVRQYGDSGDASGDLARVVGYASAVWTAAA